VSLIESVGSSVLLTFRCPNCGTDELFPRDVCGGKLKCPACGVAYVAIPLVEIVEESDDSIASFAEMPIVAGASGRGEMKGVFGAALAEVVGASSLESRSEPRSQNTNEEVLCKTSTDADADVVVADHATSEIDAIEADIVDGLLADIESDALESEGTIELAGETKSVVTVTEDQPEAVLDGLPLVESALSAVGTPHGIALDGVLIRSVTSWKDCYLAFCEKLMAIDMSKFDDFPRNPFLKRFFIHALPNKKYPDCYAVHCGTEGDVRIKVLNAGFYFYKPKYIVSQLLELYGIDPVRVTIKV